jgi:hypothetical protein
VASRLDERADDDDPRRTSVRHDERRGEGLAVCCREMRRAGGVTFRGGSALLAVVAMIHADVGTMGADGGCSEEGGADRRDPLVSGPKAVDACERGACQAGPTRQRERRGVRGRATGPTRWAHMAVRPGEGSGGRALVGRMGRKA